MSFTENRSPRHTSLYNLWKQTLMILLSCKGNLCYYKITFNLLFLFSSLCQFDSAIFKGRDHIGCVIVSVLDGSAVDHRVDPWSWQTKTRKLVYTAFPQSMQHYDVGPNGWLEIRVIGPN